MIIILPFLLLLHLLLLLDTHSACGIDELF